VEEAHRLRRWVKKRRLPFNPCGKVIVPPRAVLYILAERGRASRTKVDLWYEDQLHKLIPGSRTANGGAMCRHNKAAVKPISVVSRLREELDNRGGNMLFSRTDLKALPEKQQLPLSDGICLSYGHLNNCTTQQADRVAQAFGIGEQYTLLLLKGLI